MQNYSIEVGGGLGDLAWHYFRLEEFQKLKSLKTSQPDLFIRVLNRNVNSSAADFFAYNPFVNDHVLLPFSDLPQGDAWCQPLRSAPGFNSAALSTPEIYLNDHERSMVQSICDRAPIAVIQPSTWDRAKSMSSIIPTQTVIDIIRKGGFEPVLVGGTCVNTVTNALYTPPDNGCVSLRGSSPRVAIAVIKKARFVVGAHSFACTAANALNVPWRSYVMPCYSELYGPNVWVCATSPKSPEDDLINFIHDR